LIVSIWQNVGYVMIIMTAALLGIPKDVLESAEIDGAGYMTGLWKIQLPLCMPYITVALFWITANVFKMFELNMSLTKGGPYGSTVSMALGIYNDAFTKNRYGLATAESIIFFLIILSITSVQLYLSKRKEEAYK
jgi:raffinose/stachyose/melibiose transport system permease protein